MFQPSYSVIGYRSSSSPPLRLRTLDPIDLTDEPCLGNPILWTSTKTFLQLIGHIGVREYMLSGGIGMARYEHQVFWCLCTKLRHFALGTQITITLAPDSNKRVVLCKWNGCWQHQIVQSNPVNSSKLTEIAIFRAQLSPPALNQPMKSINNNRHDCVHAITDE